MAASMANRLQQRLSDRPCCKLENVEQAHCSFWLKKHLLECKAILIAIELDGVNSKGTVDKGTAVPCPYADLCRTQIHCELNVCRFK